jgi:hypothetical protein
MFVAVWRRAARAAWAVSAVTLLLSLTAHSAFADEQRVKRFGVALYAMPTGMQLDDVNDRIRVLNITSAAFGLAPIDEIHWGAQFGVEGRYFINRHWVAVAGFGRIKKESKLDLLPQVGSSIIVSSRILTVPRNLGVDYYFNPYTRGDFSLRPFVGGGLMDLVETQVKIGGQFTSPDTTFGNFERPQGEGQGFYAESGVHFMFPSRYSIMLNVIYRHAKATRLRNVDNGEIVYNVDGSPMEIDVSGFGLRLAAQISLFGRPPD